MQVPSHVEYERAASLEHALSLLARPETRVLAGGHSLIPMMKLRLAQPELLVDINGLAELAFITLDDGQLRIGALARHADLLDSAVAGECFPIFHDAERVVADPVVRLWGTVGGSLCQADPSEDLSAAFAAVRATMVIAGGAGTRTAAAREFHLGPYETVVAPGELLTEIRMAIRPGSAFWAGKKTPRPAFWAGKKTPRPASPAGKTTYGSAYVKVHRRAGDWPVGAAGAALWLDGGVITEAGIGLAAVGAEHFSAAEAEDSLRGAPATEESFARAGRVAAEHCHPVSDQRGPADYKRHLAAELTVRALRLARDRALARAGKG
jgi:aerobic carbon-monoxide dehydrogenase medium subunit